MWSSSRATQKSAMSACCRARSDSRGRDERKLLTAGTSLIFRSEVTYRAVAVSGDVFVRDALKKVHVATFGKGDCQGNPVTAYFLRHGAAQGQVIPLASEYTLTAAGCAAHIHHPRDERAVQQGLG